MVWRFLKQYGVSKAGDVLDEFASAVDSCLVNKPASAKLDQNSAPCSTSFLANNKSCRTFLSKW